MTDNWIIFEYEDGFVYPDSYGGDWCVNEDMWEAVLEENIGWRDGLDEEKAFRQIVESSPDYFQCKAINVSVKYETAYDSYLGSYQEAYLDWDSIEIDIEYPEIWKAYSND